MASTLFQRFLSTLIAWEYPGLVGSLPESALDRLARGLLYFGWGAWLLFLFHLLFIWRNGPPDRPMGLLLLAFSLGGATLFGLQWALRQNRPDRACSLAVHAMSALVCLSMLGSLSGLRASQMVFLPAMATLAGWLLGARSTFFLLLSQTLLTTLIAFRHGSVFHPEVEGLSPPWLVWLVIQTGLWMSGALSMAMGRAQWLAHSRVEKLASLDPLTELPNRRAHNEALSRFLSRSAIDARPMSLIILDVDHFKTINDSHSHLSGDELLRALAFLLRSVLRPGDHCARLGGDEFALILPGASDQDALRVAERLAAKAQQSSVPSLETGEPLRFSLSLGVAEALPGDSPESLYRRADQALYESKRSGRSRASLASL